MIARRAARAAATSVAVTPLAVTRLAVTSVAVTSVAVTAPVELERPETEMDVRPDRPWITLVWNDPINLMSYVSYVFRTHFGYDKAEADRLMLAVHHEGRAVVSNGTREEMERDVAAMHGYGLWATLAQDD